MCNKNLVRIKSEKFSTIVIKKHQKIFIKEKLFIRGFWGGFQKKLFICGAKSFEKIQCNSYRIHKNF